MIFAWQEKISEDLRATLNAFLYRTGEQSNKLVSYVIHLLCMAGLEKVIAMNEKVTGRV